MKNYIKTALILLASLCIFSSCGAKNTDTTTNEANDTVLSADASTTDNTVSATEDTANVFHNETDTAAEETESTSNPASFG